LDIYRFFRGKLILKRRYKRRYKRRCKRRCQRRCKRSCINRNIPIIIFKFKNYRKRFWQPKGMLFKRLTIWDSMASKSPCKHYYKEQETFSMTDVHILQWFNALVKGNTKWSFSSQINILKTGNSVSRNISGEYKMQKLVWMNTLNALKEFSLFKVSQT